MTQPNTLYFGDNLDILCKYIGDETIDLVCLDPPLNSTRDYNLLFKMLKRQIHTGSLTPVMAVRRSHTQHSLHS